MTDDAWTPDPLDGAELLDNVEAFLARFVAFPSDAARVAVALWTAHAHAVASFESSPRLALLSPEPGSGKTRTLEVLELLVPRPMAALNASPAPIFRRIASEQRTLLFDEVDALFGRSLKSDDPAADLRALLNAGHRKGATIPRCVGPTHAVTDFPVYAACALAGLGDLPETLMTRSVIVRMRRRAPSERVQPFRYRLHAPEGAELRAHLADWTAPIADELADAWPTMPAGVEDRPADVWEPLLAVADAAGGTWPDRARVACTELVKVAASGEASLGVRLLGDLRGIFGDAEALHTETMLAALHKLEEGPWGDLRGKPLDARKLARMLGNYEVSSTTVKVDGKALKGYHREKLWDAWTRYLPESRTSVTSVTSAPEPPLTSANAVTDEVTASAAVTDTDVTRNTSVTSDEPLARDVTQVTQVTADEDPEPECHSCGAPLLLAVPGRVVCERCRIDANKAAS